MRILFGIMGRICSRFVWQKHYRHVHRFVDDQIEDAAKDLDGRQRRSRFLTPQGGLINGLLRAGYDRDRIRFQAIQILILMRETTSTLVNNTLSLLSKRPDIWNELRQELMKSQDSKTSTKDGDESSLIHRCIKESKDNLTLHVKSRLTIQFRSPAVPCGWPIWAYGSSQHLSACRRRQRRVILDLCPSRMHDIQQFFCAPPSIKSVRRRCRDV